MCSKNIVLYIFQLPETVYNPPCIKTGNFHGHGELVFHSYIILMTVKIGRDPTNRKKSGKKTFFEVRNKSGLCNWSVKFEN